jgi:hypothetical protein
VLGIDGRGGEDQTVMAVSRTRILAIGRKFHATGSERAWVDTCPDPWCGEHGYPRTFDFEGRRYYLAACYDTFGIQHNRLPNPGVQAILDCVHGFQPVGEGNSGWFYFARGGFARASRQWGCTVYGSAAFLGRPIPDRWPSAVYWDQGVADPKRWRLVHNPCKPSTSFRQGFSGGEVLARLYELWPTSIWSSVIEERECNCRPLTS